MSVREAASGVAAALRMVTILSALNVIASALAVDCILIEAVVAGAINLALLLAVPASAPALIVTALTAYVMSIAARSLRSTPGAHKVFSALLMVGALTIACYVMYLTAVKCMEYAVTIRLSAARGDLSLIVGTIMYSAGMIVVVPDAIRRILRMTARSTR